VLRRPIETTSLIVMQKPSIPDLPDCCDFRKELGLSPILPFKLGWTTSSPWDKA
jgi:hypothetical protein